MPLRTYILIVVVLLGAAAAPSAQTLSLPQQVTEQDIVESMREKGIIIEDSQVKMLSTIPSRKQYPLLEAVKMETLSADASRVLLRCADRIACIPFYVVVNGLAPNQQNFSDAPTTRTSIQQKSGPGFQVIRKGSTATLEIVAPEMLITVPVVCLQGGLQGERIKVSLTDRSRTFLAEIIRPGLLRSQI